MLLEIDKVVLGKKFREYRKIMGLTQFQLAELVGLNEKQISRIEAGQNYPTYLTFAKLIEVLQININDFTKDSSLQVDNTQQELMRLIKKSSQIELRICVDVLKSVRKNFKSI